MKTLKLHDILLIAILTALYLIIYMVSMMVTVPFGPLGHNISPGIHGLMVGGLLYFMVRKVGKPGQFIILSLLVQAAFTAMGAGYLPWFVTSMIGAILAEIICWTGKQVSAIRIALASGVLHLGQILGSIVPIILFVKTFRAEWIARGMKPADMDLMIVYASGHWALIVCVLVVLLSIVGVFIGHLALRKHLGADHGSL